MKIKEVVPGRLQSETETDEFALLALRFSEHAVSGGMVYHYRYIGEDSELIDFEISARSARIASVTILVSPHVAVVEGNPLENRNCRSQIGIPIVDVSGFGSDRFPTEQCDLTMTIYDSEFVVRFERVDATRQVKTGGLTLHLIDGGRVVGVSITEIDSLLRDRIIAEIEGARKWFGKPLAWPFES